HRCSPPPPLSFFFRNIYRSSKPHMIQKSAVMVHVRVVRIRLLFLFLLFRPITQLHIEQPAKAPKFQAPPRYLLTRSLTCSLTTGSMTYSKIGSFGKRGNWGLGSKSGCLDKLLQGSAAPLARVCGSAQRFWAFCSSRLAVLTPT
ncbi:hypothetical protein V8C34DRAFT_275288, partial [Trichoderma compactum]